MTDKPENPQAFPVNYSSSGTHGMTLRDYFADNAPISMVEAWGSWSSSDRFSFTNCMRIPNERIAFFMYLTKLRYEYADAMLAERAKS